MQRKRSGEGLIPYSMLQLTTMLASSKIILFPGHNNLLATGTDDPTL